MDPRPRRLLRATGLRRLRGDARGLDARGLDAQEQHHGRAGNQHPGL